MRVQGSENSFIILHQETDARVLPQRQDPVLIELKGKPPVQQEEQNAVSGLERKRLEKAVEQANKTLETYSTELRFSLHDASGEMSVKVIDTRDHSVIREIPPERVLDFVAYVKKMLGVMIDKFI